jgi:hypothetical protein
MLVLPEVGTPLEAYNPILNEPTAESLDPVAVFTDPTPRNNTFEGFYEWMAHSRAYAEGEWSGASPWGWQAFGGNVTVEGSTVRVVPLDSFRSRLYLAPAGLWLTLDAGQLEQAEWNTDTGAVRVGLAPADSHVPTAQLRVEQPGQVAGAGSYAPSGSLTTGRGAFLVPLGSSTTWVDLSSE